MCIVSAIGGSILGGVHYFKTKNHFITKTFLRLTTESNIQKAIEDSPNKKSKRDILEINNTLKYFREITNKFDAHLNVFWFSTCITSGFIFGYYPMVGIPICIMYKYIKRNTQIDTKSEIKIM